MNTYAITKAGYVAFRSHWAANEADAREWNERLADTIAASLASLDAAIDEATGEVAYVKSERSEWFDIVNHIDIMLEDAWLDPSREGVELVIW